MFPNTSANNNVLQETYKSCYSLNFFSSQIHWIFANHSYIDKDQHLFGKVKYTYCYHS